MLQIGFQRRDTENAEVRRENLTGRFASLRVLRSAISQLRHVLRRFSRSAAVPAAAAAIANRRRKVT